MRRRLVVTAFAVAVLSAVPAMPALAHGDHDARPIARDLAAGPYRISLWQVYPDAGDAMTPRYDAVLRGEAGRAQARAAAADLWKLRRRYADAWPLGDAETEALLVDLGGRLSAIHAAEQAALDATRNAAAG